MPKQLVLIEVLTAVPEAFALHTAAVSSIRESEAQAERLANNIPGAGVDIDSEYAPLPMFAFRESNAETLGVLRAFATPEPSPDVSATSMVLTAEVTPEKITALGRKSNIRIYPASRFRLMSCSCGGHRNDLTTLAQSFDGATSFRPISTAGGIDCSPYRPAASIATIRQLLSVSGAWNDGFSGQNVIVGVVDDGIHGATYPVIGGYEPPEPSGELRFGEAAIVSHGSMCAADILVAAPLAKLLDYPMLDDATSADGAQMFQSILEQRRLDGTPQVVNNSYGFMGVPSQQQSPRHEVWDVDHPFNRKVREVIASGAAVFFASGNCGSNCPTNRCHSSGVGPGRSIHGAAALADVFTIAAVNSLGERIGYSSQGPSLDAPGFSREKPDFASYSHFFGNFGPGRPGGLAQPFDSGTSAATPVAAGVAALLLSAFPNLGPDRLRAALRAGAIEIGPPGRDDLHGHGIISAGASYQRLVRQQV